MSMQPGGQFAQVNGNTTAPQHMTRQQHIAALNEDIWAKIGMSNVPSWLCAID
jgi:hypothetical protein